MADRKGTALWSPEALARLDEIWNYYERVAGRNTAEKLVRKIGDVIVTIEDHPFAGRARDELHSGFRSLAATPHVVFYRVKNNLPEIIRILDSRRDIEEIFAD
jgi:toxin ParE1/3/4